MGTSLRSNRESTLSNEVFKWHLVSTIPKRSVTRKEKKTKFLAKCGQIPADWSRAPPEDEGWGWAGRDLPYLGQTRKRRFTDVTNIFNFSGINTEVRHLQGVTSVTLNVFGISNTSNSNSNHFVSFKCIQPRPGGGMWGHGSSFYLD